MFSDDKLKNLHLSSFSLHYIKKYLDDTLIYIKIRHKGLFFYAIQPEVRINFMRKVLFSV